MKKPMSEQRRFARLLCLYWFIALGVLVYRFSFAETSIRPLHIKATSEEGRYEPMMGYRFNNKDENDLSVHWAPGPVDGYTGIIATQTEGKLEADAGYVWDLKSNRVIWFEGLAHPKFRHAIAAKQERKWIGEPGYDWVGTGDLVREMKWSPGVNYTEHPTVRAGFEEGTFVPAPGFAWADNGGTEPRISPMKKIFDIYIAKAQQRHILSPGEVAATMTIFLGLKEISKEIQPDIERAMATIGTKIAETRVSMHGRDSHSGSNGSMQAGEHAPGHGHHGSDHFSR